MGGNARRPLDVRIIAATNRDLAKMVEEGSFRRDLYYRLNVIPIWVPPLRERPDDVLYLADYFLKLYEQRLGKNFTGFTNRLKEFFLQYSWPGNVRELQNCIEYAVNFEDRSRIDIDSLPYPLKAAAEAWQSQKGAQRNSAYSACEEKLQILKLLNEHGWTVEGKKKAARELGISLATFYRRLKCYNI